MYQSKEPVSLAGSGLNLVIGCIPFGVKHHAGIVDIPAHGWVIPKDNRFFSEHRGNQWCYLRMSGRARRNNGERQTRLVKCVSHYLCPVSVCHDVNDMVLPGLLDEPIDNMFRRDNVAMDNRDQPLLRHLLYWKIDFPTLHLERQ